MNDLILPIMQTLIPLLVGVLSYAAALWRNRAKSAEKDVEREHQEKDIAVQKAQLEIERTRMELRLQTERAENERAIREAFALNVTEITELRRDIRALQQKDVDNQQTITTLQETVEQQQKLIEERDTLNKTQQQEIAQLQQRINTVENDYKEQLRTKDFEINKYKLLNDKLTKELDAVRAELKELQEWKASMEQKPDPPSA